MTRFINEKFTNIYLNVIFKTFGSRKDNIYNRKTSSYLVFFFIR